VQPTGSQDEADEMVTKRCQELAKTHRVVAHKTWGTLPITLQAEWKKNSCDEVLAQDPVPAVQDCRSYTGGHVTE